jgi:hypothetical protein
MQDRKTDRQRERRKHMVIRIQQRVCTYYRTGKPQNSYQSKGIRRKMEKNIEMSNIFLDESYGNVK